MFELNASGTEGTEMDVIPVEPQTPVTTPKNVTFLSDNACDIHKALEKLGKFQWLGCAGHHTNLIAQAGFKNVVAAEKLLKNARK